MLCRRAAARLISSGAREKGSTSFLPILTNKKLATPFLHPHKSLIEKLVAEGEETNAKYLGKEKSNLRYNERQVLWMIKQPAVQKFLDDLEEEQLGTLETRKEEYDAQRELIMQTKSYPDSLLGLDPFSYIREEAGFKEHSEENMPLGEADVVSTGHLVNKARVRTPLDLPMLTYNHWDKSAGSGIAEFFKISFSHARGSFSAKYKSLKDRGYDHGIADRFFRNKTLARELQNKYLKHFELVADQKWDILLDYMADTGVGKLKDGCEGVEEGVMKSYFYVNYIGDNKRPKVLSHLSFPYEEKKFLQVLVRFDMKVECLAWNEEAGRMELGEHDMMHYVVFERDLNDFLSNFRIIDKISEEDLKYYATHSIESKTPEEEEEQKS